MKKLKMIFLPLFILAIASFQSHASTPVPGDDEEKAVLEANQQFFKALNGIFDGQIEPMRSVWAHTDEVTYMGPGGGMQTGWKQVLSNWEYQASLNLGGEVHPEDIQVIMGDGMAVVQNIVKGQNTVNGEKQKVAIRATQVFRKRKEGWKVVSVHTDILDLNTEEGDPIFLFQN
ncbi:MAG: nuclear transport factor 2 family protein [Phaeodactylibacter sp.]|nr:nuclear transport factor 2 family protein [Phaeodactylibacter sp.]MCB9289486.1 nuclear transport factor 2 family protein [Lewinellaceae bacterium]